MFHTQDGPVRTNANDAMARLADSLRAPLENIEDALRQNLQERERLLALKGQFESWLRDHPGTVPNSTQLPMSLALAKLPRPSSPPESTGAPQISMRSTVLHILRDARGEPVRTDEILRRALERGAHTNAKDAVGLTDFVCWGLKKRGQQPLEKVGPRTWRWAGPVD